METFSTLLALCVRNSPVTGEFPSQRPMTRGFDVFFDERLNKRLSKQSIGWWFKTPWRSLWRHCNDTIKPEYIHSIRMAFKSYSSPHQWKHQRPSNTVTQFLCFDIFMRVLRPQFVRRLFNMSCMMCQNRRLTSGRFWSNPGKNFLEI